MTLNIVEIYSTANPYYSMPSGVYASTGELSGVYCEEFGENWPRHNGPALHMHAVDVFPLWLFHEPLVDLPFTVISQFCFIITRAVVCYSSASDVTLKDTCSRDNGTRKSANRACIRCVVVYIDGLVQDCSNSIANTMELLPSYTKPSISCLGNKKKIPQEAVQYNNLCTWFLLRLVLFWPYYNALWFHVFF